MSNPTIRSFVIAYGPDGYVAVDVNRQSVDLNVTRRVYQNPTDASIDRIHALVRDDALTAWPSCESGAYVVYPYTRNGPMPYRAADGSVQIGWA